MEDNKSKAEALNKQFQSVFTGEDISSAASRSILHEIVSGPPSFVDI
jgi:hypothetical protein